MMSFGASVFVDTYDDAAIAGDIARRGVGDPQSADLLADCRARRGEHPGRRDDEVTPFGRQAALEDLAAARLAVG